MKLSFQPNLIHKNFFSNYPHPIGINYGDCFKWAFIAYKLFDGIELFSHETHAFIRYREKFYDSETTSGIKNYRKLRTIKENQKGSPPAVEMTPREFISYWSIHNKCDWNALSKKATTFLMHYR